MIWPPAIPRPRGRGLIEASDANIANSYYPKFHDRAVVASLKLVWRNGPHGWPVQFHDRAVVASLKRCAELGIKRPAGTIPRPRGRGLIEASRR